MRRMDESNTLDGINNNTYNLFFIDKMEDDRFARNDREFIYAAIQQFTKLDDDNIEYVIEKTDMFKKKGIGFEARYKLKKYNFILLDYFLKDEKEKLRSEERLGKCIYNSICLARNYDGKCKVIIGYLENNTDRILHSIFMNCEMKNNFILDYTMNIVMKEEDYMELFDFKIINEISGEDIKKDINFIPKVISSKFYLCFRNEIIKDLKKNEKIFRLEK